MEELRTKGSMEELMCAVDPACVVPTELKHNRTLWWVLVVSACIGICAILTPVALTYLSRTNPGNHK